jgi:hypothetical protein
MTRARLLVLSSPVSADVAEAFDLWYDQTHIPQVVAAVPGIVSGQRHVRAAGSPGAADELVPRRLTIYEIESADVQGTVSALFSAMGDGTLDQTSLMDRDVAPPEVSVFDLA